MKEIQISGSTYLLVEILDKEANGINYFEIYQEKKPHIEYFSNGQRCWIELPPGRWPIIGKASELTEDQWKGIVEKWDSGKWNDYSRYLARVDTATESGKSLLTHHGYEFSKTLILKQQ